MFDSLPCHWVPEHQSLRHEPPFVRINGLDLPANAAEAHSILDSTGGGQGSSAIAAWAAAHFKKLTVGGETAYDLTQPISGMA